MQRQYEALVHGAGLADLFGRGEIELTGNDRASFLHNFCTADVKRLEVGQGCEAFFCNLPGKILGHGYIFCGETSLAVDTAAGEAEVLIKHLDRYLIREDVQLADRTAQTAKLLIAGEKAAELIERVSGASAPEGNCRQATARIDGTDCSIRRIDYAGPVCFFVVFAANQLDSVRQSFIDAGGLQCGDEAVEIVRIEAGTPLYGRDISENNLPQEVGRDQRAISFNKGCYLGQETVARIDALGHVNRNLVGLKFAGESVPEPQSAIRANGQDAGTVTSAVYSPRLAAPLALAYVKRGHSTVGTKLESEQGAAEVVALPIA